MIRGSRADVTCPNAAAPKEVVERLKQRLDAPVVQLYTDIGALLKAYTGGRVPIAFKLLPRMDNWEELLWLTHPHKWSPAAMYYATRLFASNLNEGTSGCSFSSKNTAMARALPLLVRSK